MNSRNSRQLEQFELAHPVCELMHREESAELSAAVSFAQQICMLGLWIDFVARKHASLEHFSF